MGCRIPYSSDLRVKDFTFCIRDCMAPPVKPSTVGRLLVPDAPPGDREVAIYIAAMTAELSQIAQRQRLDVLVYLLDMVRLEAEDVAQRYSDKVGKATATK